MNKTSFNQLLAVLTVLAVFFSCSKKTEELKTSLDYSTEKEFSSTESDFNTVFKDVSDAMDISDNKSNAKRTLAASCVTSSNVTVYPDSAVGGYSHYLEVDFMTSCTDVSFKNRAGKIFVYFTGNRTKGDYKDSVVFNSFKLDNKAVTGYVLTTQIEATADVWAFNIMIKGKTTSAANEVVTYESNRVRKHTGISTLLNFTDDTFVITGTATGKNSKGDVVTSEIVTPIVIKGSCLETYYRIPVEGKVTFKNSTKNLTRSLDYGSGTCDREVSIITNDGNTFKWSL